MTVKSKGYLRHVALSVTDPWETAEFYKQTVGLEEVAELDGPLAEGVFLTDGVVNLAILHFKSDEASQGTGVDYVGLHHIGFWVDDVIVSGQQAVASGATWIMGDPKNPDGGWPSGWSDGLSTLDGTCAQLFQLQGLPAAVLAADIPAALGFLTRAQGADGSWSEGPSPGSPRFE